MCVNLFSAMILAAFSSQEKFDDKKCDQNVDEILEETVNGESLSASNSGEKTDNDSSTEFDVSRFLNMQTMRTWGAGNE